MLDLLHSLSKGLEDWCNRHAHTIALLEAISTTAAVIVALSASYAAKRNSRPRLTAWVDINLVIMGDGTPVSEAPAYVTVRLTNTGTVPVRLPSTFFSWQLPFVRSSGLAMPVSEWGDEYVPRLSFPLILQPWTSQMVFLHSLERFRREVSPGIFKNGGRLGRAMTTRLLRGVVYTEDGSLFRAKFGASFRKELET